MQAIADASERLRECGLFRTNNLPGDVGEWVAAKYYGVELAPTVTRGYDLIALAGRRIQVKTLTDGNNGRRYEAGRVLGPCDVLLMIRLAPDFTPIGGLEVDFGVIQEVFGERPVRWSLNFAADPRVRTIPGESLSL